MRLKFFFISALLFVVACTGSNTTNTSKEAMDFQEFVDEFPVISLPYTFENKNITEKAIPETAVKNFLNKGQTASYSYFYNGRLKSTNAEFETVIYSINTEDKINTFLATIQPDGEKITDLMVASNVPGTEGEINYFTISEDSVIKTTTFFAESEADSPKQTEAAFKIQPNGKIEEFSGVSESNQTAFRNAATGVLQAINDESADLQKFIHPEIGCFTMTNPGVFYVPTHVTQASEVLDVLYIRPIECDNLRFGEIPYYDCETGWDKEGCYFNTGKYALVQAYQDMVEYKLLEELPQNDVELAQRAEDNMQFVLYSTHNVVGLYFGKIDGQWYLLCVDAVTPCDA